MTRIQIMEQKKAAAKQRALDILDAAEKEERFLSEAENTELEKLEGECRRWDDSIARAKAFGEPETGDTESEQRGNGQANSSEQTRSAVPPLTGQPTGQPERRFNSFGEQLAAVYRAACPDGSLDARLSTRAATGANETLPSDGGFLVQTDFVSELLKRTYETGLLAARTRRIPISAGSVGLKINAVDESSRANGSRWGGIQAFWNSEAETVATTRPKFRQMELSLKKLTGICYATDELLQDSSALEAVIREGFSEEFGFKLDDAILRGSGAGEPLGILNSDALVTVGKENGQSAMITPENLIKMWSRLHPRSKASAVWYINSELEPALYMMRMGDTPLYIPPAGMTAAPYGTLLGRPVLPIEHCSAAGEVGDIMLADLSQYLMIDKGGVNAASSIHVRFLYDENVFRFIYRVDGQPVWNKPLTPYKGSGTLSPFVALQKRA